MEFPIANPGIDPAQARRIFKGKGLGATDGHIGLIRVMAILAIHPDHFVDLWLKVLSIGIGLIRGFNGGDLFFEILFDVIHGGGRWNADSRRDVRDQRPCARMKDVDNHIIIFEPLMAYEASSIDRVFVAFFKEVINTLKPGIRQIPRLDELNFHCGTEPPSTVS